MVTNLSPSTKEAILEYLEKHPAFLAVLDDFLKNLPERLADSVVDVETEVIEIALSRLRENLDKIDTGKIAEAVLANDRLRGKIKVEIDDLGLGVSQRLQADIKELMTTEINLIRNLLTARREKKRAERAELASELSISKQEREKAWIKVQLAWMRFSKLTVALPTIAISLLAGVVITTNYFPAIGCEKGDPVCKVRIRDGLYWKRGS